MSREKAEQEASRVSGFRIGHGVCTSIADALEAFANRAHNEAIEAAAEWHEAQALATDSRITDLRHQGYAKAIRALKRKDPP